MLFEHTSGILYNICSNYIPWIFKWYNWIYFSWLIWGYCYSSSNISFYFFLCKCETCPPKSWIQHSKSEAILDKSKKLFLSLPPKDKNKRRWTPNSKTFVFRFAEKTITPVPTSLQSTLSFFLKICFSLLIYVNDLFWLRSQNVHFNILRTWVHHLPIFHPASQLIFTQQWNQNF